MPVKAKSSQAVDLRLDSLKALLKGVGDAKKDINTQLEMQATCRVPYKTLQNMYSTSSMFANIIDFIVDDAQKEEIQLHDRNNTYSDTEKAQLIEILDYFSNSGLVEESNKAAKLGRLTGEGFVFPIFNGDNEDYSLPLNLTKISRINKFNIYDESQWVDTSRDGLGNITHYHFSVVSSFNTDNGLSGVVQVHESRVLRFSGRYAGEYTFQNNNYHHESVITQELLKAINSCEFRHEMLNNLLNLSSVPVIQMDGLTKKLSSKNDNEWKTILERWILQLASQGVLNTVLIDKDDTYTRENIPNFQGCVDLVRASEERVCQLSKYPASKLLQEGTGAKLNGGKSESQERQYADSVKGFQNRVLKPNYVKALIWLQAIYKISVPKLIPICFENIIQDSEIEKAQTKKLEAETEKIKAETEVLKNNVVVPGLATNIKDKTPNIVDTSIDDKKQ